MLDIKFIRENTEAVKKAIKDKGTVLDLDEFLKLDEKRRELISKNDELRARRNDIAEKMTQADEATKKRLAKEGREVKDKIEELEKSLTAIEKNYDELMLLVPNIASPDTPVGGERDYQVIIELGEKPEFDFPIKDHIELGKSLDILDLERGVKVAGFRGYFLKNEGVLLQQAILWLALRKVIAKGFTPMTPPTLVREFTLTGSGHFPAERQEIYQVEEYAEGREKELKFLTGTAEPSLLAYHADEILEEKELPIKLCGISPCYRREVGGYGKDTKGIYRVHEFMKVEQVVLCKNDMSESEKWFEQMNENAQEFLQELGLPYRVVQISTRDMGAGKYKMYDLETWMPARNAYKETHSNSNMTDWQARRLNVRYRRSGELEFVHTLNNTMIASPRILIAILENNQQKDGSVKVPKILQEFVGKEKLSPK